MTEFSSVQDLLVRTETARPAAARDLEALLEALPNQWPPDYLDCLRWSNGLEGYVAGRGYLWLWPAAEVPARNTAYGVGGLCPDLVLFGSDVASLGYGFDFAAGDAPVVSIEMAAMHREHIEVLASSFTEFIRLLASEPLGPDEPERPDHKPPDWLRGKVIHEKHPIVLGGDPTDPANRVLIPREDHPRTTVLLARVVHAIREKSRKK